MEDNQFDLDNLFRKNVSEYEHSGKSNWELFRYLLKEQERKIKIRKRIKIALSVVTVASAVVGILWLSPGSRKETDKRPVPVVEEPKNVSSLPGPNSVQENDGQMKDNSSREAGSASPDAAELKEKTGETGKTELSANDNAPAPQWRPVVVPDAGPKPDASAHEMAGTAVAGSESGLTAASFPANESHAKKSEEVVYDFSSSPRTSAWEKHTVQVKITNMGKNINSPYDDFAPIVITDDAALLFTSRRPQLTEGSKKGRSGMDRVYRDVFDKNQNEWKDTVLPSAAINATEGNSSVISLSKDGKRMFLYRSLNGDGDIYESDLQGKTWSEPVKLPEPVNSAYHESSASLSPDGKTLYFVSNRPGGAGGRDIWYCALNADGKWGPAVNLGEPVNTPKDEEAVFIHPDGKTLYFSSKGHEGLGKYDVFRSVLENGKWSAPFNPGAPVNTPGDDLFFVTDAAGITGYYTSTGQGGFGGMDIYKVVFIPTEKK